MKINYLFKYNNNYINFLIQIKKKTRKYNIIYYKEK